MLNGQSAATPDAVLAGAESGPAADVAKARRWDWLPGWLLATAILSAVFGPAAMRLDLVEPDNAMRLVQVRDLLGGQDWFDLSQHRMGPDAGLAMHWARWIDGLIAAPILVLTPVLGADLAERVVAFAWPLGLLALFMGVMSAICRALAEDAHRRTAGVVGPVLAALAFPLVDRFAPGSFDHHGIVAVLLAAGLLGLLRMSRSPVAGAAGGIALAAAMAAAAEALPLVAAGLAGAGLAWLSDPVRFGRGLACVGAGLSVGALAFFLVQVPPSLWGAPVCDTMSTAYLAVAGLGGAIAVALGRLGTLSVCRTVFRRLAAGLLLGIPAATALVFLFPECRGGGYGAVSRDMETLWMAQIAEARSIFALAEDDIALLFALCGASTFGLAVLVAFIARSPRRPDLWMAGAFLVATFAVMVWQVRGAALATAFAIPFATLAVVALRARYRENRSPRALLAFVGAGALACSAVWSAIGVQVRALAADRSAVAAYEQANTDGRVCTSAEAYAALANAPSGMIVNQFGLGPSVLLHTAHRVLAGPYHRNEAGTLAAIHLFRSDADSAFTQARRLGARYVLICSASPESVFYAAHPMPGVAPEDTLAARLTDDRPPDWLKRISPVEGPLRLYEVAAPTAGED